MSRECGSSLILLFEYGTQYSAAIRTIIPYQSVHAKIQYHLVTESNCLGVQGSFRTTDWRLWISSSSYRLVKIEFPVYLRACCWPAGWLVWFWLQFMVSQSSNFSATVLLSVSFISSSNLICSPCFAIIMVIILLPNQIISPPRQTDKLSSFIWGGVGIFQVSRQLSAN